MEKSSSTVSVTATRFSVNGDLIGVTYEIPTVAGPRWLAEAHDWDNGNVDGDFDPITIGVFDDPDQANGEIEQRARSAQAPEL